VKLLADTSALLAFFLRDDRNHHAAARFVREGPGVRWLTTDLVLAELTTRLRARVGAARAVAVAGELLRSGRYDVLFVDEALFRGALAQMARFSDKRVSLTDCASFEVIERLGLDGAFSFDRDFRDCGFRMVP
jgi:predicted nucleic acid-binding protein